LTEGGEVHSYQERKHHTTLKFEQRASDLSLSSENLLVVAEKPLMRVGATPG